MRALVIADEEDKYLWDYFSPEKLDGIDLIIGCGDMHRQYLTFLATMAHVPLIYVHGNHDESYDQDPPGGALCIDDDVYIHKGVRIAGLGGSVRYRNGAWQFTEAEMRKRIRRLRGKIERAGGLDVLVTHAPLHGYGDLSDLPHRGFTVFHELLDQYHPPLMLHGHVHLSYGNAIPREQQYGATRIINACGRIVLELPDPPPPKQHRGLLRRFWR